MAEENSNLQKEETVSLPRTDDFGCEHYRRKCAFIAPCCQKKYTCRVCHDDKENHEINRHKVMKIQCLKCDMIQQVGEKCNSCGITFGRYFCPICRLFDDVDKGQFHCKPCGICRVGGQEKYFHCDRCDMCLLDSVKDSHKCIEKASRSNCPVCMDDLHTSRQSCHIPPCGHLIHVKCYNDMLKSGNFACAVCNQSMIEMEKYWSMLDEEISATPMPDEYKDTQVQILCRDCHKESRCLFHIVGLKCQLCGSYNTCRAAEPEGGDNSLGQNSE